MESKFTKVILETINWGDWSNYNRYIKSSITLPYNHVKMGTWH